MSKTEIKETLHNYIEESDEKQLNSLFDFIKANKNRAIEISETERGIIVQEEREKYLRGEGINYSWEEVKKMAITKQRPNAI